LESQRVSQVTHDDATVGAQGGDGATLAAEAEALCRAVAGRDLASVPLYIVAQSSLPPEAGSGDHCYGYTTPSLDLYLRPHLPHWIGRGPCMVINDLALAEDHHADDLQYVVQCCVLHELAHILDRPALFADRTDADPLKLQFEALVVADATGRAPSIDVPAYYGHGASFIRIALHLCHRATRHGVDVGPGALCAGYRFGLSPAFRYQAALGDEPARMADWLISDILAAQPPPAFTELWNQDLADYHDRFPLPPGESYESVHPV
jgi:hypothetical protein